MSANSSSRFVLSVIIPSYNYAKVVERSIRSVMEQMDGRTELVVVDDGSTDNTPEILKQLIPASSQACHVFLQSNAGPAAARNRGLRYSTGKYVLFLDADDELLPLALQTILDTIETSPDAGLILGAHKSRFVDGREKLSPPTPIHGSPRERISNYLIEKRISVSHGCCVFRRDLVECRPYPEQLRQTEDIPVFAYLVANAKPVLVNHPLARIHKHPDSLRHDATLALTSHKYLVDEVFAQLPAECQSLRPAYEAKRALSVFRSCYQAADWLHAQDLYLSALKTDWRQALRWRYLSKYLLLAIRSGVSS